MRGLKTQHANCFKRRDMAFKPGGLNFLHEYFFIENV